MADELGSPSLDDVSDPIDEEASPLKRIVTSRWWGAIFLWFIMANTVTMALYRPTEPADSDHNRMLETVELVFLFVFTFELILKLAALGGDFFKDHWNNLDFVIVVTGYMVFLPGSIINTSVFRTVRVLRPLRSIGMMPGVRILIDALIMSLPGLSTLLVLVAFVYAIFGVMGVQLFKDAFLHHCVPALQCAPSGDGSDGSGSDGGIIAMDGTYLSGGMCTAADATTCSIVTTEGVVDLPMPSGMSCQNATVPSLVDVSTVYSGQFSFCIPVRTVTLSISMGRFSPLNTPCTHREIRG
eukprot:SAG31_NODE_628_length_13432_cov_131.456086_14_plen_298_part_00